jgi:histidyl-tRNA synthetase
MSLIKPRIPSGTLELMPRNQMVFQHMLDVIRRGYERFGFVQVETPIFEYKDILLTKSGGETEKQVYFVQSTGSLAQGYEPDMALHFDLTVPLARYVAMRERELAFPFRRYQIQRSYRGERPQKGRAREFYQCDIDVIGKDKLDPAYDAELPAIIVEIFTELGLTDFTIHFSNRKILLGLLEAWGITAFETQTLIVREIDKLDKIGNDKVRESVLELGLAPQAADKLLSLIVLRGTKEEVLEALRALNIETKSFAEGLRELEVMVASLRALGVPEERTRINLAIARGLDYYTGTVYETLLDKHPEIGSICSGGRYDNLASMYSKSRLPGVGLSIGATRLYELLESLDMLPPAPHTTRVLITQQDESLSRDYLALAALLRKNGVSVENYLEPSKLDKQLKYADKAGIPYTVIFGAEEKERGTVLLKDMGSKQQIEVKVAELADVIKGYIPPSVLD